MQLEGKAEKLRLILRDCGRVALAFSGGVDSSLLLKCALDTLGARNVLVLFAQSELLTAREIDRAILWPEAQGYGREVELEIHQLHPLDRNEFVSNGQDRCYICKHRIYSLFRQRMHERGMHCLIDGTNLDDLKEKRPGLRAIHELGVRMPLVDSGFSKAEVRLLSQQLGLDTWNRPSASCLATRIPSGMPITGERLQLIDRLETVLDHFGLAGCRVRLTSDRSDTVHIEILAKDFDRLADAGFRSALIHFFHQYGIEKILLDLEGRE